MRAFLVATLVLVASVVTPAFSAPLGGRDTSDMAARSSDANYCEAISQELCEALGYGRGQ